MALIFVDGFDHYASTDFTKKWTAIASAPTIGSSAGRRSGGAMQWSSSGYATKTLAGTTSWVIGFAMTLSFVSTAGPFATLLDAASTQCDLRINLDQTLSVTRAGTAVTGGTSILALALNTYYYIEWKVTIADSIAANSCKVRVNGVDWITVATGQDLKATANTTANQIRLGGTAGGLTGSIDDLYICDNSGSTNNDFLGDCRVDTLLPNGDGNYTSFTPSTGTTHYLLVDESTPNTSDYNESSTVTNKDSYQMVNLGALASQTIYGIQVSGAVLKDDAGVRSLKVGVRSSSTDSVSAAQGPSTSQLYLSNIHETDPATATAWTESGVNAAESLFEVA